MDTHTQLPLQTLCKQQRDTIEAWFLHQLQKHPPLVYSSVDVREASFKAAAIDTNLFPAGFNNLAQTDLPKAAKVLASTLHTLAPNAHNLLIIPENHSRNPFYAEHLRVLTSLCTVAGFAVRLGTWLDSPIYFGDSLPALPFTRDRNTLIFSDFIPDCILLNNDLSSGIPELLLGIKQPILPAPTLGWAQRLKTQHFLSYQQVVEGFAKEFNLDPWWLNPLYQHCGEVNFKTQEGLECVAHNTEVLLNSIDRKYREYGITAKPFVMLKADAGTYGMGVMPIFNPKDVLQMNRKQRLKMSTSKGGQTVTKVMLQEGIPSDATLGESTAEMVIYAIGNELVGGFYRAHPDKSGTDNLNSPGMYFEPVPLTTLWQSHYLATIPARLAFLAATLETGV